MIILLVIRAVLTISQSMNRLRMIDSNIHPVVGGRPYTSTHVSRSRHFPSTYSSYCISVHLYICTSARLYVSRCICRGDPHGVRGTIGAGRAGGAVPCRYGGGGSQPHSGLVAARSYTGVWCMIWSYSYTVVQYELCIPRVHECTKYEELHGRARAVL